MTHTQIATLMILLTATIWLTLLGFIVKWAVQELKT